MNLKCKQCGNVMDVPDEISDGQHVRCPYCGEKTAYERPTRIEVPLGAGRIGDVVRSVPAVTPSNGVSKPKLAVRRPTNTINSDPNFEAISRKLEAKQQKRVEAGRQQQTRGPSSRLAWARLVLLTVLLLIGGAVVYFLTASHKTEDHIVVSSVDQEKEVERERSLWDELATVKAQLEQLRVQTNCDKSRVTESPVCHDDVQQATSGKGRVVEKVIEQNDFSAEKIRQGVEKYRWAEHQLRNAFARPFSMLSTYKKPGACDGDFVIVTVDIDANPEYHFVSSKAGGDCLVEGLSPNGVVQKVYYGELQEKLKTFGGFVCSENVAYVLAPEDNSGNCQFSEGPINPAKARLGVLYDLMRDKGLDVHDLSFELWLRNGGERDAVLVSVSRFGETVDRAKILDRFRNVARKTVKQPADANPKNRTVVFYDGSIPKKLMNGVTLVPRNPINPTSAWRSLRDEAERQELLSETGLSEEERKAYDEQIEKTAMRLMSTATPFVVMRQTSQTINVPAHIESGFRTEPASNPTVEEQIVGRTSDELKRLIKEKNEEHLNLRKKNPACVLKKDLRNIRNLEYRLLGREDKRYYYCKNVTYVRDIFYCTKCKRDFENHYCDGSKISEPLWRAARDKISETLEINAKIDAVLKEKEALEKELKVSLVRERSVKSR